MHRILARYGVPGSPRTRRRVRQALEVAVPYLDYGEFDPTVLVDLGAVGAAHVMTDVILLGQR
jgi:hypothetical protein